LSHEYWKAVILGIVEGLTEFLPVSSTGHLIIAGDLLNFTGEKADSFEIFIQLGAILAVLVLYWHRFVGLIPQKGLSSGGTTGFKGYRGILLLALTTFPALVAGYLARNAIRAYLFGPKTVILALGVGGIAILLAEKYKPLTKTSSLDEITYPQAFMIGCFQCLSLWPGMSRSASTIVGGLVSGLGRKSATEYSFLAAVPVMIAATGYDLLKSWKFLETADIAFFAIGFLVSFIVAAAAIKTFIALVQRWSLAPYAYYRIIIALVLWYMVRNGLLELAAGSL
jgi:undecaprenyl-diphosphatase